MRITFAKRLSAPQRATWRERFAAEVGDRFQMEWRLLAGKSR